jgi:hypothetical protein
MGSTMYNKLSFTEHVINRDKHSTGMLNYHRKAPLTHAQLYSEFNLGN